MDDKVALRKHAKEIRNSLDIEQISSFIVSIIRGLKEYQEAKRVMIFYPLDNEIDLLTLLSDEKEFYLPRMSVDGLECCPYREGDELKVADFGVKEPVSNPVDKNMLDMVFVPALCVDESCNRLGYGKGFYDRFLSGFEGVTVVPVPEELVFEDVCSTSLDVVCKKVVTQARVFSAC